MRSARPPRRLRAAVALGVILAAGAYGFFGQGVGSKHKSLRDAGFTPVSGFSVDTPAFRFEDAGHPDNRADI